MTKVGSEGSDSARSAGPRKPWLAALLAVFCAGLGHLYAGRPLRALAFSYGAGSLAALAVVAAVWLDVALLLVLGVVVLFMAAVYLWQMLDAVRCARRAGPEYALRRYNHPLDTERPSDTFVKRVIGLPGETVEVRHGVISVDGKPLEQRSAGEAQWEDSSRPGSPPLAFALFEEAAQDLRYIVARTRDGDAAAPDAPATRVPEGHYFVLGDNRDNSADSRTRGPVPRENVVGVAQCVWFSTAPTGLRTERIGLRL